MELKKSYKGLIFWGLGYTAAIFCPLFSTHDTALVMRLIMNITTAGMALLCGIILKTEAVYWFNGTEYEEAVKAGTERTGGAGGIHRYPAIQRNGVSHPCGADGREIPYRGRCGN